MFCPIEKSMHSDSVISHGARLRLPRDTTHPIMAVSPPLPCTPTRSLPEVDFLRGLFSFFIFKSGLYFIVAPSDCRSREDGRNLPEFHSLCGSFCGGGLICECAKALMADSGVCRIAAPFPAPARSLPHGSAPHLRSSAVRNGRNYPADALVTTGASLGTRSSMAGGCPLPGLPCGRA